MKATGIVRRIDDLGRVVIPKEIRRTLRIREGDPLEIFTDRDGEVILKKYSPMTDLSFFAQEYADSLYDATGCIAAIADDHEVVRRRAIGAHDDKVIELLVGHRDVAKDDVRDRGLARLRHLEANGEG